MRVNISLKLKFFLLTFVGFLITATVVYFVSYNLVDSFFIESSKNDFARVIQNVAEANLNLEKPVSLKTNDSYQKLATAIKSYPDISNLNIIESNGIVIYSENSNQIGQNMISEPYVSKAINGEIGLAGIDQSKNSGHITVPIKNKSGVVRGVITADISLSENLKKADEFIFKVMGSILGISVIFIFISYYIYSDATGSVFEKDRSIIDKSKALEEEQQLDEAIMSSIAESLIVINKDGQIMVFNPEAERISGIKSKDVEFRLYKKIINFSDKDGKEIAKDPITECLNSGKIVQVNTRENLFIKNEKKELVPVFVNAAPIFDKNHDVRGVVATIQDATAVKELDKVKDEFVYVVAHELGNPIFALDGYLSILQDSSKKYDKNTRQIIDSARNINQDLSGLVNDLLEVVRSESGQLKIETAPIDFSQITFMVTENSRFKAKEKKIKLEYQKRPNLKVMGDDKKIQEVLTNLIDNAIKYTPSGGKVEVWHDVADKTVTTHVKDNGLGMSKEALSHLFEKFYRVKTEKTKGISGTGLGLFICKQIVEKCGGKIWAESEEGKGSVFSFSLKVAKK